jgi:hypothetical protein
MASVRGKRVFHLRFFGAAAALSLLFVAGCGGGSGAKSAGSSTRPPTAATTTLPAQDVAADQAAGEAAVLKLADLPRTAGWTAAPYDDTYVASASDDQTAGCLGVTVRDFDAMGPTDVHADEFADPNGNGIATTVSYRADEGDANRLLSAFTAASAPGCLATHVDQGVKDAVYHPSDPSDSFPPGLMVGDPRVAPLPLSPLGDQGVGYRVTVAISGQVSGKNENIAAYGDYIVARKGRVVIQMDFMSLATAIPVTSEQHYAALVLSRLTRT